MNFFWCTFHNVAYAFSFNTKKNSLVSSTKKIPKLISLTGDYCGRRCTGIGCASSCNGSFRDCFCYLWTYMNIIFSRFRHLLWSTVSRDRLWLGVHRDLVWRWSYASHPSVFKLYPWLALQLNFSWKQVHVERDSVSKCHFCVWGRWFSEGIKFYTLWSPRPPSLR